MLSSNSSLDISLLRKKRYAALAELLEPIAAQVDFPGDAAKASMILKKRDKFDKDLLIELFLGMQGQMEELSRQTQALNDRMQLMMEQMVLFQKNRFGRSSEKMADPEQIRFMEVDGTIVFFNEAEAVCDLDAPEPDDLELKAPKKKKQPGKKAADIAGLTVKRIDHYLKEEELTAEFGENGWKQLPDAISRCYQFIPASVVIEEHHIGVYSSKLDEHMIKAPPSQEPASWKPCFPIPCCCNHKW